MLFPPVFIILLCFYVVVIATGFIYFKRISPAFRCVLFVICADLVAEFSTKMVAIYFHLTPGIQLFFQMLVYIRLFKGKKRISLLLLLVGLASTVFCFYNAFTVRYYTHFPSTSLGVLCLYVSFCSLLVFFYMIQQPEGPPLYRQPLFWFNTINLFFYSTTFFTFSMLQIQGNRNFIPPWQLEFLLYSNYLLYTVYFISLLMEIRRVRKGEKEAVFYQETGKILFRL